MPAGMRLPRLETKIKYEKSHCFGRRHGRSYLSWRGCGRSAPTALREEVEILFVGAEGKMEMEKVPALGYRIVGLPVAGLQRRFDLKNLAVPFKVLKSIRKARRTIRDFGADVVVGFGGYASGPVLWAAQRMGIPTVIQEQNSYAGVTNKLLAKRARTICVSYEGMERFFPKEKIVMTGNPLRGRFRKRVRIAARRWRISASGTICRCCSSWAGRSVRGRSTK